MRLQPRCHGDQRRDTDPACKQQAMRCIWFERKVVFGLGYGNRLTNGEIVHGLRSALAIILSLDRNGIEISGFGPVDQGKGAGACRSEIEFDVSAGLIAGQRSVHLRPKPEDVNLIRLRFPAFKKKFHRQSLPRNKYEISYKLSQASFFLKVSGLNE